jgi:hypothetical protein
MQNTYTYHDSRTGEFVSEEEANNNPDTTIRILRQPNLDLATPMELLREFMRRAQAENNRRSSWLSASPTEGS